LNAQVLGVSVDHIPCLKAWADSLGGVSFPLLSDFWPHGAVAQRYGVLRPEGFTERALFLIDAEGTIRYIDVHAIDDQPSNEVILAELAKLGSGEAPAQTQPAAAAPVLPHGGIVMYCTQWCPDCRRAKVWLRSHGLEYTEVDVHATPGAADKVREWAHGHLVTPTFDIDGKIVVDFDEVKLKDVLGLT
jgi:glutaredoxin